MKQANESGFQFKGFKITRSLIEHNKSKGEKKLSISFSPKGVINKENSIFTLFLKVIISDDVKSLNIEIEAKADYQFKSELKQETLNNYFYINAPAILFPYLRAYISSLTALSGIPVITLPTLNLTNMGEDLKNNTTEKNL